MLLCLLILHVPDQRTAPVRPKPFDIQATLRTRQEFEALSSTILNFILQLHTMVDGSGLASSYGVQWADHEGNQHWVKIRRRPRRPTSILGYVNNGHVQCNSMAKMNEATASFVRRPCILPL